MLTFIWYICTIIGMLYNVTMSVLLFIWPRGLNGVTIDAIISAATTPELTTFINKITPMDGFSAAQTHKIIIQRLMNAAAITHAVLLWLGSVKFFQIRKPVAWWASNTAGMILQVIVATIHVIIAGYGIAWFIIWTVFGYVSAICLLISYCFPWGQARCCRAG
jgi:hypothetical protein